MQEKVLITGASGFIGKYVVELLKGKYEIETTKGDIFSIDWEKYMQESKPDYLINLAWKTGTGYLDDYKNILFVKVGIDMYDAFYKAGGKRAVFIGTEQEYDRSENALKETDNINPVSLYSECKAALGNVLVKNSKIANRGFVWCRLFFVYGYGEKETRLMPAVIKAMLKNEEITCSNSEYIRDYIYVKDVASAIETCLFSDYTGIVNIAGGERTTIGEIAQEVKVLINSKSNIIHKEKDGQPEVICGDVSVLKSLGWEKKYSLCEGLKEEIEMIKGEING